MNEISFEELLKWPKGSYQLIDIRDEGLVLYGMIPGAVHISMEELEDEGGQKLGTIPKEKKLVFYCQIGRKSLELDEYNALEDRECYSLEGGYMAYIRSGLKAETDTALCPYSRAYGIPF